MCPARLLPVKIARRLIRRIACSLALPAAVLPLGAQSIDWAQQPGSSGSVICSALAEGPADGWIAAGAFTQDLDLQGAVHQSLGGADGWIADFDAAGQLRWSLSFGSADNDQLSLLRRDSASGYWIGFEFWDLLQWGEEQLQPKAGSKALALLRVSDAGLPAGQVLLSSRGVKTLGDLQTAPDGGLLLTGSYSDTLWYPGGFLPGDAVLRGFVLRIGPDAAVSWARSIGLSNNTRPTAIYGRADGTCLLAGWFNGIIQAGADEVEAGTPKGNFFWMALDAAGQGLWVKRSIGTFENALRGMVVLEDGSFVISGHFTGLLDLQNGVSVQSFGVQQDLFFARLDAEGQALFARQYGGPQNDQVFRMAVQGEHILLSGSFSGDMQAGDFKLQAKGNPTNGFILELDPAGNVRAASRQSTEGAMQGIEIAGREQGLRLAAISADQAVEVLGQAFPWPNAHFNTLLYQYRDPLLGTDESGTLPRFALYPNPSQGSFRVEWPEYHSIALYNSQGILLAHLPQSGEYDLAGYPPGLYHCLLLSAQKKPLAGARLILQP